MTTSHPMIPTDPSIFEEDSQALVELLVVIIELAQMTFAYPLSVMTHLGEPWSRTGALRSPRARAARGGCGVEHDHMSQGEVAGDAQDGA